MIVIISGGPSFIHLCYRRDNGGIVGRLLEFFINVFESRGTTGASVKLVGMIPGTSRMSLESTSADHAAPVPTV